MIFFYSWCLFNLCCTSTHNLQAYYTRLINDQIYEGANVKIYLTESSKALVISTLCTVGATFKWTFSDQKICDRPKHNF